MVEVARIGERADWARNHLSTKCSHHLSACFETKLQRKNLDFLGRDGFWDREDCFISFCCCDHRQSHPCVSPSSFAYGSPRFQSSTALSFLDNVQSCSVFHASGRVQVFTFRHYSTARRLRKAFQLYQRSVANSGQHATALLLFICSGMDERTASGSCNKNEAARRTEHLR